MGNANSQRNFRNFVGLAVFIDKIRRKLSPWTPRLVDFRETTSTLMNPMLCL